VGATTGKGSCHNTQLLCLHGVDPDGRFGALCGWLCVQRVGSGGVPKLPSIGKGPGSGGRAKAPRYSDNNENRGPPAPARTTSEDPEVELLNYIKTGDDVVEFYARQGKESEVKFFYCNRADTGIFFRPYDLVRCATRSMRRLHCWSDRCLTHK
jgi:hypothetical protein